MRERALREMGLAPGWVRRRSMAAVVLTSITPLQLQSLDLEGLRLAIESCQACPRAVSRTNAVAGQGTAPVRVMVIDHVPSRYQAANGALQDGDAGRLLDQLLFSIGLTRDAVYLSHALRCDGARPSEGETSCCAPYLQREIELLAPRALLVLGSPASQAVTRLNAPDAPATPRQFVIAHPVDLLSDGGGKRAAWATLRELRAYLAEG